MRVLISTWPASGHLQPIVPLSWALRGAGHEVIVTTPQHLVPFVKSTGLDAIALGEEQDQKMMLQGIIQQAGENASPAEAATNGSPAIRSMPSTRTNATLTRM